MPHRRVGSIVNPRLVTFPLLMACAGPSDTVDDLDYGRTQVSDLGSWTVSYAPTVDPVPAIDLFGLEVEIDGGEGLFVDANATMPLHNHGMNTATVVTERGGGIYDIEGMSFHMTGDWELVVAIDDGNSYERAFFWIHCCEPNQ